MAIHSAQVNVHSRSRNESATGGAAYRLGIRLQHGIEVFDYSRRKDIEAAFTLLPDGSPVGWDDPAVLWVEVEKAETRKNSCVSREVLVALPAEMTPPEREALARSISNQLIERYGVAISCGMHKPDKKDGKNYHAHILMSTRRLGPDGFTEKTRELDDLTKPKDKTQLSRGANEVKHIREMVAIQTNEHLEKGGYAARIDHRSIEAQRAAAWEAGDVEKAILFTREPTRHEGRNPDVRNRVQAENEAIRQNNVKSQGQAQADFLGFMDKARSEGRLMPSYFDDLNRRPDGHIPSKKHLSTIGLASHAHRDRTNTLGGQLVPAMPARLSPSTLTIPTRGTTERRPARSSSDFLRSHESRFGGDSSQVRIVHPSPLNNSQTLRLPKKNTLTQALQKMPKNVGPMASVQAPAIKPERPKIRPDGPGNSEFKRSLVSLRNPNSLPLTPMEKLKRGPKGPSFGR